MRELSFNEIEEVNGGANSEQCGNELFPISMDPRHNLYSLIGGFRFGFGFGFSSWW